MQRRVLLSTPAQDEDNDETEERTYLLAPQRSERDTIACFELLALSPLQEGYCEMKKDYWLNEMCPCLFGVQWRHRFLVLAGNFLFRFEDKTSEKPKGIPIPIDSVRIELSENNVLVLSTIRKQYHLKMKSSQELSNWAGTISQRQNECIRESMGHAVASKNIVLANKIGGSLYEKKLAKDNAASRALRDERLTSVP